MWSSLDSKIYLDDLVKMSNLSRLFSESATPYLHSRFVERLFCFRSGSLDLGRRDISFDAISSQKNAIGIKTYVAATTATSKMEKVSEFTNFAKRGNFLDHSPESLAHKVSELRNLRLRSDLAELGAHSSYSFYHCVVRVPGQIFFLEQPYDFVNIASLCPTDRFGVKTTKFNDSGHVYFNDGNCDYSFNIAKNVLYKRFSPVDSSVSAMADVNIRDSMQEILEKLDSIPVRESICESPETPDSLEEKLEFVVLPLYSPSRKAVMPSSGINQWNAGGRERAYGESYIPVPQRVHMLKPGFFPGRETPFLLKLPNGEVVTAKICQEGGKALMANPNNMLCKWLFSTIDGSFEASTQRMASSRAYTYSDLESIGKDSVRVTKTPNKSWDFEIETAKLGAFEDFVGD